jgi:hypothetical protein
MKKAFLVAAGLAFCFGFVPAIGNAGNSPSAASQASYQKHQEATKTFSGMVAKQGDVYVLTDRADKTNYQLVDSKKVGDFVGKNVKVTIHVQDIQEIA